MLLSLLFNTFGFSQYSVAAAFTKDPGQGGTQHILLQGVHPTQDCGLSFSCHQIWAKTTLNVGLQVQ